jgi:hypothetical protein
VRGSRFPLASRSRKDGGGEETPPSRRVSARRAKSQRTGSHSYKKLGKVKTTRFCAEAAIMAEGAPT